MTIEKLARALYEALAAGDRTSISELLHPEFEGTLAEGMPVGGGTHRGPEAMMRDGWWAIGREFAVRAVPEEWVACEDGRLLVLGRYQPFDAAFAHLWAARDGRLHRLVQITDTARWPSARPAWPSRR